MPIYRVTIPLVSGDEFTRLTGRLREAGCRYTWAPGSADESTTSGGTGSLALIVQAKDATTIDQAVAARSGSDGNSAVCISAEPQLGRRARKCPRCGGKLVRIVWGMPDPTLMDEAERGQVAIGGCCVPGPDEPSPFKECRECGWTLYDDRADWVEWDS